MFFCRNINLTAKLVEMISYFLKVLVLKWDHKTEDLTDEGISTEMVERIRAGLFLSPSLLFLSCSTVKFVKL